MLALSCVIIESRRMPTESLISESDHEESDDMESWRAQVVRCVKHTGSLIYDEEHGELQDLCVTYMFLHITHTFCGSLLGKLVTKSQLCRSSVCVSVCGCF